MGAGDPDWTIWLRILLQRRKLDAIGVSCYSLAGNHTLNLKFKW
ncbi:hypothetical protein [Tumidithrix elongata]